MMLRQLLTQRPLLPIVGMILIGIILGHFLSLSWLPLFLIGSIIIPFSFFRVYRSSLIFFFIGGLFLWTGMVLEKAYRPDQAKAEIVKSDIVVAVQSMKKKKNKLQLIATFVSGDTGYQALIHLKDSCDVRPKPGDLLQLSSGLFIPSTASEPGGFDYKEYLQNRGVQYISYPKCHQVELLQSDRNTFAGVCWSLANQLLDRIDAVFQNDRTNALVKGILLGYKEDMEMEESQMYRAAGIGHVFAVSGMHVGMVYLFFLPLLFFRNFNVICRWGIPILVLAFVWLFVLTSGLTPSAIRAGLMITLYEGGKLFYRPIDKWNILAFSALLSVLASPGVVFDIGFQFSYLALSGIFLLFAPLSRLFQTKYLLVRWIFQAIVLSVSAQVVLLPLSMYYFGAFSPYFWLSSLVAMMVVQVNFILAFITLLIPTQTMVSAIFVSMIDGLFLILWQSISGVMEFKLAKLNWTPTTVQVLATYLVYLCAVSLWKSKRRFITLNYCIIALLLFIFSEIGVNCVSKSSHLLIYGNEEVTTKLSKGTTSLDVNLRAHKTVEINSATVLQYYDSSSSQIYNKSHLLIVDADHFDLHQLDKMNDLKHLMVTANVPSWLKYKIKDHCNEKDIAFGDLRMGFQKIKL